MDKSQDSRDPPRSTHPPHLRGKAIGMYYAKRSREKGIMNRVAVSMTPEDEEVVRDIVETIKSRNFTLRNSLKAHYMSSHFYGSSRVTYADQSLCAQPHLDTELYCAFQKRLKNVNPQVREQQKSLPAFNMKESILRLVEDNQVVLITGETGCGKTTQVPQYILDSFIEAKKGSLCKIVCTQPRRISAISVAERVAQERGIPCGGYDVGYQIRMESKAPQNFGSILFCTTGIMLQRMQSDRYFSDVSHLVIDEVHEQDVQTDFLLMNCQDILDARKGLKLILMSATVNAESFSNYFGNCPILNIPGFTYPVQDIYLEDILDTTGFRLIENQKKRKKYESPWMKYKKASKDEVEDDQRKQKYLNSLSNKYSHQTVETLQEWNEDDINLDLIVHLLRHIHNSEQEGAVLVFLPGLREIRSISKLLATDYLFCSSQFRIIPLHSLMPSLSQCEVFEKPPVGVRKIILSTNIAETSITIDDVVFVVDGGKMKMKNLDMKSNIQTLDLQWICMSNFKQRRGRAGRIQAGICYHLFTRYRESQFLSLPEPELVRTRLEEIVLNIKMLKLGPVVTFLVKAMIPPDLSAIEHAIFTLKRLNALDFQENLTALGYHLARLPMDPQTGKMILLASIFSCLDPILSVAASLSHKDAFIVPLGKEREVDEVRFNMSKFSQSDHLLFANAIAAYEEARAKHYDREFCSRHFLCQSTLRMLQDLKNQYCQYLVDLGFLEHNNPKHRDYNINSKNELLLRAIICAGLYPNVAKVTNKRANIRMKKSLKAITEDGKRVSLHPGSVNAYEERIMSPWIVYHLKMKSSEIFLYDTTPVKALSLLFFGGKLEMKVIDGYEVILIDDWIDLQCPKSTADLILCLREELDQLLDYKITHPGVSNWNLESKEGRLLKCIINMIIAEESRTVADLVNQ